MAKKLTAAQRTLIHPAIDMHETPRPEAYVKPGPKLRRAVGGWPYSVHFFHGKKSLCGAHEGGIEGFPVPLPGQCGVCALCRVEASKMRAVVR